MTNLEHYLKSENDWIQYAKSFESDLDLTQIQPELLKTCSGHIDIARVISFHLREHSMNWMRSKVPALDGLTPLECINDDILINRLKVCLMRFPC